MTITWIGSVMRADGPSGAAAAPEATHGSATDDGPRREDVGLEEVTAHGWRVTDDRLPQRDPLRLLGFIERRDEVFEVMQIGDGFEWNTFGSLAEALAHILSTATDLARRRMSPGAASSQGQEPVRVRSGT